MAVVKNPDYTPAKEEVVKISLSEYSMLKLCENKLATIKRAVEADTDTTYGYNEKTSAVIDFLLEVKRGSDNK